MPEPVPAGEAAAGAASRGEVIGAAWATRAFAALCVAAGAYAASVSLFHIIHGEPRGTWLLPLATGTLAAVLGVVVACERGPGVIARSEVARRAGAVLLLGVYGFVLLPLLGFLASSVALVAAVSAGYASRKVIVACGGLLVVAGLWAFFTFVLAEPLPRGLW